MDEKVNPLPTEPLDTGANTSAEQIHKVSSKSDFRVPSHGQKGPGGTVSPVAWIQGYRLHSEINVFCLLIVF